jgi:hypothetical protein
VKVLMAGFLICSWTTVELDGFGNFEPAIFACAGAAATNRHRTSAVNCQKFAPTTLMTTAFKLHSSLIHHHLTNEASNFTYQ